MTRVGAPSRTLGIFGLWHSRAGIHLGTAMGVFGASFVFARWASAALLLQYFLAGLMILCALFFLADMVVSTVFMIGKDGSGRADD